MAFDFDFWDLDASATAGSLAVTPDPVPVRSDQKASLQVSWSGLDPASKYLGYLTYANSPDITLLDVRTP
jgi:hypothetical protein